MRMAIIVAACAVVIPATSSADVPTKLAGKPTALLGDHVEVSLPTGMKLEARGHDIMSADQAGEDETRAVLDDGSARLVMMAYELYATTGPDFKAAATADANQQLPNIALEPVALSKPLAGFAAVPPTKGDQEANLIYMMWLGNADATVQVLAFYINPAAAKTTDKWLALAKKIAATAVAGKRVLATKAGDRALEDLVVTLPDGWAVTPQPGPDFVVFHLRKTVVLGTSAPGCGIYLGGFASYQYSQNGIDAAHVKKVAGKLMGANVDWYVWNADRSSTTEAMTKTPKGETAHVFCSAPTEGQLADLRKLAETLRQK